ncbi:MAG TPA: transcription antitermination factor NusB [Geminicoccaceae bacterium]|nr:transcription antitermination factor NusB [Geminicoccaceae bacterium]
MAKKPRGPAPALNKRRAARFAAVQALYQLELGQSDVRSVVVEFGEHRLASLLEPLELQLAPPVVDRDWFRAVVFGVAAARDRLDPEIEACLAPGWTLARCGYLLRACLRAGAFELAERTDVPVKVVINEYVEVAHLFFEGGEPAFVNAVLDRLAPRLRPVAAAAEPEGDGP